MTWTYEFDACAGVMDGQVHQNMIQTRCAAQAPVPLAKVG
jgi:hypothetical protein